MKKLILLFFLAASLTVQAGVYKWVDENGKVHYGDQPLDTQPSIEMSIDDPASVPASRPVDDEISREEKRERLLQSMEEDRLEKQEQRKKQQALKEQNRLKCNRYRDQMRHHERAHALYKLDKDGNRVYLSDKDRATATKNLRAKINKFCR